MTLYEAEKGNSYCIKGLYMEPAITRRLEALGLNDGTIVSVLNRKKHGALIIRVRGTRLALGKHISSNIEISGCQGDMLERRNDSEEEINGQERSSDSSTYTDKGEEHER